MMKRDFTEIGELDLHSHIALANCLMLLSRGERYGDSNIARVFECKTCNKKFPSFQALGGHRASHKKPRLSEGDEESSPMKLKTHECSICGLEFSVGQALGGHMRRHRAALSVDNNQSFVPIVKKPNCKRVLWLDLNLTPKENIDLQLRKRTPIDC